MRSNGDAVDEFLVELCRLTATVAGCVLAVWVAAVCLRI